MKYQKLKLLQSAKSAGLFDLARKQTAPAIRILCYHGIWTGPDAFEGDAMFMRADTFARRIDLLRQWGYPVITLDAALEFLKNKGSSPKNAVVITIDDGWYSTAAHMLPILIKAGMPATLYCDTANLRSDDLILHVFARYLFKIAASDPNAHPAPDDECEALLTRIIDHSRPYATRLSELETLAKRLKIDLVPYRNDRAFQYMTPDELKSAHSLGLDIQLHTHNHTLRDMSAEQIITEVTQNRAVLSDLLEKPKHTFRHFCYPSGATSEAAAEILAGIGIASSTTTVQSLAWPGTNPQLLPRLLDNDRLTDLEFEAELCGFADQIRNARSKMANIKSAAATRTAGGLRSFMFAVRK